METPNGIRFEMGDLVRVVRNVRNDGTFAGFDKGDLLVEAGQCGEVRSYGYFLQTQVIFQVFFPEVNRVVGVRDNEVIDAALPWIPCQFHSLDKARLTRSLSMQGELVASKGDVIEVQRALRNLDNGQMQYEVAIGAHTVRLDSAVLETV